jgi:hypothetical protein
MFVRRGDGLNWLRIVSNGRLWYLRCRTFGLCYQRVSFASQQIVARYNIKQPDYVLSMRNYQHTLWKRVEF